MSEYGGYDKAIANFTEAVKLIPTFTESYFERAMVYLLMDNMELARQEFDRISALKQE
ncbi:hypothetical protein JT359_20785 [Candidatus Poribacteria bacterium]|nr:hypothetical protein [Candidatus Poribacteria bacterium]